MYLLWHYIKSLGLLHQFFAPTHAMTTMVSDLIVQHHLTCRLMIVYEKGGMEFRKWFGSHMSLYIM